MFESMTTAELRRQFFSAWAEHLDDYLREVSAAYVEFDRTHDGAEFCRRRDVAETCFQATFGLLNRSFQERTGESLLRL